MNDATRELGAALGVAVLGSIAASRYTSSLHDTVSRLPHATQTQASGSLAGALQAAAALPGRTGAALATGAQHAFLDGVHLAAIVGVLLAAVAAAVVLRFLPGETSHQAEVDAEPLPADTDDEVDDLVLATEELSA